MEPGVTDILDSLLQRIDDDQLRDAITTHVAKLKDGRKFGLVFEDHLPEAIRLPNAKVRRGSRVARRDGDLTKLWTVAHVRDGAAIVVDDDGSEHPELVSDLDVVREWGEPVYPGLKPVASVAGPGADPDAPHHVVINGENLHALEALRYTHAESVDLIYIDPPYNTGNDSWIYNDRYVSGDDAYRHSKWLSFMHRRLELARALLKPTGVIIVASETTSTTACGCSWTRCSGFGTSSPASLGRGAPRTIDGLAAVASTTWWSSARARTSSSTRAPSGWSPSPVPLR